MTKGFAPPKQVAIAYHRYTAELKKRFLSDNSELMIGSAEILIPKHLHDPLLKAYKREVWDAVAIATAFQVLLSEEARHKGINQIFLFTNKGWLLERIELNPWSEDGSESGKAKDVSDNDFDLMQQASTLSKINITWLDMPTPV